MAEEITISSNDNDELIDDVNAKCIAEQYKIINELIDNVNEKFGFDVSSNDLYFTHIDVKEIEICPRDAIIVRIVKSPISIKSPPGMDKWDSNFKTFIKYIHSTVDIDLETCADITVWLTSILNLIENKSQTYLYYENNYKHKIDTFNKTARQNRQHKNRMQEKNRIIYGIDNYKKLTNILEIISKYIDNISINIDNKAIDNLIEYIKIVRNVKKKVQHIEDIEVIIKLLML